MDTIVLNEQQEYVVQEAFKWYIMGQEQTFQYDGPPGSGKSVVLNEIVRRLRLDPLGEVAAMSFIGCASLVMRNKGLYSAKTAHSWLYEPIEEYVLDANGNKIYDKLTKKPLKKVRYVEREYLPSPLPNKVIKLIVVDEAYAMPIYMRKAIEKFGIKIIACGDQNQLPPINSAPAFLVEGRDKVYHLTECMRQADRRDIIYISNMVKNGDTPNDGYYGNSLVINKENITDDMLMWADVVICGTNRTRDYYNKRIRSILGYHDILPCVGEKVVCRQNNWDETIQLDEYTSISLVNGLMGSVSVNSPGFDERGERFILYFRPYLMPIIEFGPIGCDYNYLVADPPQRSYLKENGLTKGDLFEYAYAITSHISQGSQFHKVLYIEDKMKDQNKINLVGASRADECLIYAHM